MIIKSRLDYAYEYTPKCHRLLDVGCDKGFFTIKYLRKANKVYAIDPSHESICLARKNSKKIIFKIAFAEKIPFPDSFFDVVVITDAFEHVNNEKKTISEIYRVLKPGGKLIFSVPYKGLFRFLDSFNMKFYFPRFYKWFKGKEYNPNIYEEAPWHRHYSLKEIDKFFNNKFRIIKLHRGGLFIFPLSCLISDSIYWKIKKMPKIILRIHDFFSNLDYSIDYKSFAYHTIIKAQSQKSK